MRCETFETKASAYLDQELSAQEAKACHSHLAICPLCRNYLAELEETALFFKQTLRPAVPRELHGYVMTALERRITGDISLRQRAVEWLLSLNPRPFSFATGAVVSILLFAVTLSGFKPIPVDTSKLTEPPVSVLPVVGERVTGSDNEFNAYNGIAINASATDKDYYQIPQMLNPGAWTSFSHIAYQKPGNESMAVLVRVGTDGHAEFINVLDDPKDPALVEQLWWTLGNPTFQPATVNGQPVATQMVLFVEKMDVGG
jgi:hypothetical protein